MKPRQTNAKRAPVAKWTPTSTPQGVATSNGLKFEMTEAGHSGLERPIKVPSAATLKKYGLTSETWLEILKSQDWRCAICKQVPKTGRFVTDHAHVPRYKKLPPEKRRAYVRGLTCWWCNHTHLGRGITEQKAVNVALYLRAFAVRTGQPTAFGDRVANAWAAYDATKAANP